MWEPSVFKSIASYFVRWIVTLFIYEAIIGSYSEHSLQKMLAFHIHMQIHNGEAASTCGGRKNDPVIITVWSKQITAFFSLSLVTDILSAKTTFVQCGSQFSKGREVLFFTAYVVPYKSFSALKKIFPTLSSAGPCGPVPSATLVWCSGIYSWARYWGLQIDWYIHCIFNYIFTEKPHAGPGADNKQMCAGNECIQ